MGLRQFHQTFDPFSGLAESVVSSRTLFFGDAVMVDWSVTTSSATASRWTWMGFQGGTGFSGFQTALPVCDTNNWQPIKVATGMGYYSFDTIPQWGVLLRTPSASSTTFRITMHMGPG